VGDHLSREDRLDADVVGDRGEDRGVLGQIDRRPWSPTRIGRAAKAGHRVPGVGGGAPVAHRQPAPADLDSFAAQLGASRAGVAGTATIYRSTDFRLDLVPATSGQEPRFVVSAGAFSTPGRRIPDGRSVADAFLNAHPQLRPGGPSAAQVHALDRRAAQIGVTEGGAAQAALAQRCVAQVGVGQDCVLQRGAP